MLENVELKNFHTLKVCSEIIELAKFLNVSQRVEFNAEITALFHDIGRFEQFKIYRTFSDSKSVNHADLGLKILQENKVLESLNKKDRDSILEAVRFHNCAFIPKGLSEESYLLLKMIRDADKLDIFRVVTEYYMQMKNGKKSSGIELNLPDSSGVSKSVYDAVKNKVTVKMNDLKNLNDFKLLQVAWVFDINFSFSLKKIVVKKYLDIIKQSLPDSEEISEIFFIVNDYIKLKEANVTTSI